jgi:hypothetical protein
MEHPIRVDSGGSGSPDDSESDSGSPDGSGPPDGPMPPLPPSAPIPIPALSAPMQCGECETECQRNDAPPPSRSGSAALPAAVGFAGLAESARLDARQRQVCEELSRHDRCKWRTISVPRMVYEGYCILNGGSDHGFDQVCAGVACACIVGLPAGSLTTNHALWSCS